MALIATVASAAEPRLIVEADVGHARSARGEMAGQPLPGATSTQRYAGAAVGVEVGRFGLTVGGNLDGAPVGDLDGAPIDDGLDREVHGVAAEARIVVVRMPSLVVRTLGDADVALAVGPAWRWRSTPERFSCADDDGDLQPVCSATPESSSTQRVLAVGLPVALDVGAGVRVGATFGADLWTYEASWSGETYVVGEPRVALTLGWRSPRHPTRT